MDEERRPSDARPLSRKVEDLARQQVLGLGSDEPIRMRCWPVLLGLVGPWCGGVGCGWGDARPAGAVAGAVVCQLDLLGEGGGLVGSACRVGAVTRAMGGVGGPGGAGSAGCWASPGFGWCCRACVLDGRGGALGGLRAVAGSWAWAGHDARAGRCPAAGLGGRTAWPPAGGGRRLAPAGAPGRPCRQPKAGPSAAGRSRAWPCPTCP